MISSTGIGYLCAVSAAVLGGTWQAIVKADALNKKTQLHPAMTQLCIGFGFFCASWLALAGNGKAYEFTSWGLLSGFIA